MSDSTPAAPEPTKPQMTMEDRVLLVVSAAAALQEKQNELLTRIVALQESSNETLEAIADSLAALEKWALVTAPEPVFQQIQKRSQIAHHPVLAAQARGEALDDLALSASAMFSDTETDDDDAEDDADGPALPAPVGQN